MATENERSAAMRLERVKAAIQLSREEAKAGQKGCITVGGLVAVLIGETARTAGLASMDAATSRADAREAQMAFINSDASWSAWLKEAVGRHELLVRELATLGPANATPAVRQWTESSAADLPGYVAALVVLKADARRWLEGLGVPLPPSLQGAGEAAAPPPAPAPTVHIHTTKALREHWLDAAFKAALAQAVDPSKKMSVWHQLCAMASSQSPPEPLMGMTGTSIRRRDGSKHKLFDYDAFSKYWRRKTPGNAT